MRSTGQIATLAWAFGLLAVAPAWAANGGARALLEVEALSMFETVAGSPMQSIQPRVRGSYPTQLVRKIQNGLADQGFYLGPIDGRFGPRTEASIRAYQKSADLPLDGKPSSTLAMDLETSGKVGKLLNRLEKMRAAAAGAARTALLSRPETRHLVDGFNTNETAPHDKKACMATPNPKCLLIEASISAGNIEKPEMRDWALGEILTAQAKAGLAEDALKTTRRIHDPRLIMVALRNIATAQASAGNSAEALAAVDIIPNLEQQIEAYVAIAESQVTHGQKAAAKETALHTMDYLQRIKDPLTRIQFHARIAVVAYKAGNTALAQQHIRTGQALISQIPQARRRDEGLRYIAGAYAETGAPAQAMAELKRVQSKGDDFPVLIAAATGLAQAGEAGEALITAESIKAVRYRALVLARIASYQARAGKLDNARAALEKAFIAAKKIRFPFAKAYAFSRIALALNDISISAGNDDDLLAQSMEAAALIKDDRLRAHILWTIADTRRRAQDTEGTALAQGLAMNATEDIKSPFSRVWMLSDISEERARRQEMDGAWALFNDALSEAKSITHAWGRARALSKVASTMTVLTDATRNTPQR